MSPRDLFWRAVGRCNYSHAASVICEVWHKEIYLAHSKHSHASVALIGIATFGPQNAAAGVDWVNDTGVPGAPNWRLAGAEPK